MTCVNALSCWVSKPNRQTRGVPPVAAMWPLSLRSLLQDDAITPCCYDTIAGKDVKYLSI